MRVRVRVSSAHFAVESAVRAATSGRDAPPEEAPPVPAEEKKMGKFVRTKFGHKMGKFVRYVQL